MYLYKFTHIPLLKSNVLLKPKKKKKSDNKSNHPNLLGNINHVQKKKSCLKEKQKQKITTTKKKSNGLDMPMCKCTWAFLSSIDQIPPIFSLFQKENILVCLKRKHLGPTNFFPPPTKHPQKKFFFPFSLQSFSSTYFTSKQTQP